MKGKPIGYNVKYVTREGYRTKKPYYETSPGVWVPRGELPEVIDYRKRTRHLKIETQNKLRVPYFLARDIVNTQSVNSLFEKNILSTLLAYQSTEDTDLLPPFADTTNSYDYKVWNLEQTQTLVQQILENNIGYTQFKETKESTIPIPQELQNLPLAQGLQNVYVKNFFGENREYSIVPENQKGEISF